MTGPSNSPASGPPDDHPVPQTGQHTDRGADDQAVIDNRSRLRQRWHRATDDFRHQLAYIDALPQLTLLGLVSGILAALVIVALRLLIELPLTLALPGGPENFEGLARHWYFLLPALGGIVIGLGMQALHKRHLAISVSHVLQRLHNYQGRLPLVNICVQFVGAVLSLLSGQSVGREGPAVHLGAGVASQLGQWLKLPNNSLRTLVGCGVAAAISASFNTPMAGVIFAMEVVLMEYTITGFIPIILASVTGAVVTRIVFGPESALPVADIHLLSLLELPYVAVAGLVIAACASLYIHLILGFNRLKQYPIALRLGAAGILTGCIGFFVPQILGLGYDTVAAAINGEFGLILLLLIIAGKLFATAASVGLGMPGGLIGPSLMMGAGIGGAMGLLGNMLFPGDAANMGFYVLLGMAAMMGAVLNAPLAALMAILELTYNPNIIFPSMLIIVVSCVATRQLAHRDGIFVALLEANGSAINAGPAKQILSRVGVRSVMNTAFLTCQKQINYDEAHRLLSKQPLWLVVEELGKKKYLLRASDLANYLEWVNNPEQPNEKILGLEEAIDLTRIPGQRFQLLPIHQEANLYEAQLLLQQKTADAIYVERTTGPLHSPVMGIITRDTINNYYQI